MDTQEFISFIKEPGKLGKDSLNDIEDLTRKFPYCQSLKILHLLNLRIINHVMYSEQLKSTAAYIADRRRLKELTHGLKKEDSSQGDLKLETRDSKLETRDSNNEDQDLKPVPEIPEPKPEPPPEPIVPIIEQDEEARLLALKEIVENRLRQIKSDKAEELEVPSKEELIEKFIKEEPSISRPRADFFDPVKVARSSTQEQEGLVSETLARIHVLQGNIEKAIEIYRKLSLNFPEKSAYFAAQITKISTEN